MVIISFATEHEKLIPVEKPALASGDVETVKMITAFDRSWDGYAKSAVFYRKDDTTVYEVMLQEDDSCVVPHEVLCDHGTLIIGVRGVNDEAVYTSTVAAYKIEKGAPEGSAESLPPSANIYQQILTAYATLNTKLNQEEAARSAADSTEAAARSAADAAEEAARKAEIAVERTRIDNITSLGQSSVIEVQKKYNTTGDTTPLTFTLENDGKCVVIIYYFKSAPNTVTYTSNVLVNSQSVFTKTLDGDAGTYLEEVEFDGHAGDVVNITRDNVNVSINSVLYVTKEAIDTELADIRVGVDGTIYPCAGDAVRGQVSGLKDDVDTQLGELKGDLDELNSEVFGETIETDVTGEILNGVIIDTRTGTESTKFPYSKCTDFIELSDNADYYYTGKIYNYIGIAGYNSNGEFVASVLSDITENFTDYKLTIPDGVTKIRASSYSPSESVINPLQVVKKVKTSNLVDEVSTLNDEVSTLNKNKGNITTINHIYVATTGSDEIGDGSEGNPFATIYHVNETITDATEINQYIIHVADGEYTDLQTRYSGVQTHENYEGIKCKPWVTYEGNVKHPENVVIKWDGKTGYGDEFNYKDHAVHFCPFHITGSNGWTVGHKEIRGFTFDCKNTRYALHVEMSGYGYGVTWRVSDCLFVWHGVPDCSDITYQIPSIGTGSGHYEKGHLLRCKIINDSGVTDGFRNHDSKWVYGSLLGNLPHVGAEIVIEDCVFNGGDSGDTVITFRTINGNGLVDGYNRFSIINCVGINRLGYSLSGGSTECEWRADVKCSKIVTNQFLIEGLLQ